MELKNNFSLTKEEASDLLFNVANSLKNRGKFEITLQNQAISLDIGDELNATLTASDTRFSLDFKWIGAAGREEEVDWRNQFDKDMAEAGLPIGDTEEIPIPVATTSKAVATGPSSTDSTTAAISELQLLGIGDRRFAQRMILETTTLPYEGGVWNPAFNLSYAIHWTEIGINNQLENTKWISEEELEALQGTTRVPRAKADSEEDDLFDDLDSGDMSDVSIKRPQGGTRRRTRQVVTPAAIIHHSTGMNPDMDEATIQKAASTWSEPEKEKTGDEWVKPSEVIAEKGKPKLDTEVPGPLPTPKRDLTPPPVTTTSPGKLGEKILDWKEPDSTETGDDWVKPSEILKQKNKKPKNTKPPVPASKAPKKKSTRPPPVAPDKGPSPKKGKKGKSEDDEKKGWASWDK